MIKVRGCDPIYASVQDVYGGQELSIQPSPDLQDMLIWYRSIRIAEREHSKLLEENEAVRDAYRTFLTVVALARSEK